MAINPILQEINGLSPGAKTALMNAHTATTAAPASASSPQTTQPSPQSSALIPSQPQPVPMTMQAPSSITKTPMMGAPTPALTTEPARLHPQLMAPPPSMAWPSMRSPAPDLGVPNLPSPSGFSGGKLLLSRGQDPGVPGNAPLNMSVPAPQLGAPQSSSSILMGPKRGEEMYSDGQQIHPGTITGDTIERQRDIANRPGVDSIYHNITSSHFGQEHPFLGKFLGGVAEVGGKIGDTLASAFPGIGQEIPGTTAHHNLEQGKDDKNLENDLGISQKEATTANLGAETEGKNLENANDPQKFADVHNHAVATTANQQSETYHRDHPPPDVEIHDTPQGLMRIDKQTGLAQPVTANGQSVGSPIKTLPPQVIKVNGVPHDILFDQKGNKVADLGVHFEKPTPEPGSWELGEDPTGKTIMWNNKTGQTKDAPQGIAKPGTHAKAIAPYQGIVDEASMAHHLADAANAGNAPADVDLALSFFKTMKGAAGSGIRFTQAEQNMIRGARSSGQDLTGIAQKVLGGGQFFTPDQRNKIVQVIDMHAKAAQQHIDEMSGGGGDPAGMVQVQIPGQKPGFIPSNALTKFQKDHPNAQVTQ